MSAIAFGAFAGIALAALALAFGPGGFFLGLALAVLGALIAAIATGALDLRAAAAAARGRSVW
ncbi:hypothetical protein [Agrococcus sp. Marseille-P2731]|uniref:hypothetical protein n=1 Tax=Agrococcus sp. Marseille-P2731 TaxID=1841862 RepID=UPI00092FEB8F|nr:hypothetical protein [Agrococcus sp. Marseille-P2731]